MVTYHRNRRCSAYCCSVSLTIIIIPTSSFFFFFSSTSTSTSLSLFQSSPNIHLPSLSPLHFYPSPSEQPPQAASGSFPLRALYFPPIASDRSRCSTLLVRQLKLQFSSPVRINCLLLQLLGIPRLAWPTPCLRRVIL
ncbi:hypothetical protein BDV59DRAFT_156987 [Aspergillus ambiguus]|uniref:uncharacterized protein n=1 Tax=Aspergillus ambiguus TaxID=176160 RepID=UPI003CCD7449